MMVFAPPKSGVSPESQWSSGCRVPIFLLVCLEHWFKNVAVLCFSACLHLIFIIKKLTLSRKLIALCWYLWPLTDTMAVDPICFCASGSSYCPCACLSVCVCVSCPRAASCFCLDVMQAPDNIIFSIHPTELLQFPLPLGLCWARPVHIWGREGPKCSCWAWWDGPGLCGNKAPCADSDLFFTQLSPVCYIPPSVKYLNKLRRTEDDIAYSHPQVSWSSSKGRMPFSRFHISNFSTHVRPWSL